MDTMGKQTPLPILLLAYSRADFISRRLKEISEIKPKFLIVSIDKHGDRAITKSIQDQIHNFANGQNYTNVRVISRNSRIGLANHLPLALDEVFDFHERVFVLEDDISISQVSFSSINSQIDETGVSSRLFSVGGFSPLSLPWKCQLKNSWRKTKYFSAWGWAIRKEVWQDSLPKLTSTFNRELEKSEIFHSLSPNQQDKWLLRFKKSLQYPGRTWDIPLQFATFAQNYSHILPKYRLVDNLGYEDKRAENTSNKRPKWMLRESSFHREVQNLKIKEDRFMEILDGYAIGGDMSKSESLLRFKKEMLKCK